ncbi:MAG: endonuclease domain-containing protein [Candidatus Bipolaricaulia bacterium]
MAQQSHTERARRLRQDQTEAERALWQRLRRQQLKGIKFRRQQPVGPYIVDFVSFEARLIIEVDGGQHNDANVKHRDQARTDWLESNGYRVVRFWNHEVLENEDAVIEQIRQVVSSPSP